LFANRSLGLLAIIVMLICVGTLGYCWLEGWSFSDGFYMTVITISTVGYTEIGELSPSGRAFTSGLILVSIVCMAYWTARITSVLIEGDLSGAFRAKRMKRMARKMRDHVIVCGSGIYAQSITDTLYRQSREMVIVTDHAQGATLMAARFPGTPLIQGSPTEEIALAQAGITRASHVVAATEVCIDNLLISMTCKQLNPSLQVFSFSLDVKLASRMMKVGVDQVICPHVLGGDRVAELINRNKPSQPKNCPADTPEVAAGVGLPGLAADLESLRDMNLPSGTASFQIPFQADDS